MVFQNRLKDQLSDKKIVENKIKRHLKSRLTKIHNFLNSEEKNIQVDNKSIILLKNHRDSINFDLKELHTQISLLKEGFPFYTSRNRK